jgi:hypothetical protein
MVKISEIKGIERIYAATEDNCTVEFACGYNSALDIDIEVDVEKVAEILRLPMYHHEYKGGFVDIDLTKAKALSTSLKEWLRVKGQKGE